MAGISREVVQVLEEAGWHAGRTVDTTQYACNTQKQGYRWLTAAQRFLQEFGGLQLYFLRNDGSVGSLHFNVLKALASEQSANLPKYALRFPELKLCVIGEAYTEGLLLLMDKQGQTYGFFSNTLYLIAPDGRQAIEAICLDREFRELWAEPMY